MAKHSAWTEYRKSRTVRVKLDDIGLTDYWIDVLPTSARSPVAAEAVDALEGDEAKQDASLSLWVLDWNLPCEELDDEGKEVALPLPSESGDYKSVIPLEFIALIAQRVAKADEERINIPFPKGSPSSQPSKEKEKE